MGMVQHLIVGVLKYRNTHRAADESVLKYNNTLRVAVEPEDRPGCGHGLDPAVQPAINAGTCIVLPSSLSMSRSLSLVFMCVCVCAYVCILSHSPCSSSLSLSLDPLAPCSPRVCLSNAPSRAIPFQTQKFTMIQKFTMSTLFPLHAASAQ